MRVFWLHLRNSPIRWTIPLFIALDVAVLFLRSRYWIGSWPETGAAAQVPAAFFLGSVGAGAAAWAASAPGRHRLGEQLAVARTHPVVSEAYRLGATIAVLLVPYIVGYAAGFALTARTFPPGVHLWAGYFFLGLFAILLATCWGWLLGKLFGSVFAALVAVLGWFVLASLLNPAVGLAVVSGSPDMMVDLRSTALRLGAVTTLVLALLWLPPVSQLRESARRLPLPAVASIAMGVVLLATTPVIQRAPADDVTCVDGQRTQLCIWPEHEKYLPTLEEISLRIDRLPGVFNVPPRINERGVERTEYVEDGVVYPIEGATPSFSIIEGSPWSYAGAMSYIVDFPRKDCDWNSPSLPDPAPRLRTLRAWLEAYLVGGGLPDYRTDAPPDTQDAWTAGRRIANERPIAEQLSWAEGEVESIRDRYCQPNQG